jgi:fucose 4-O-acetylase-like acetyltransferase
MVNPVIDYYWDPARSLSMDVLLLFINTFRMPVFFLLAGFFAALLLVKRGEHALFENRRQRILLPFLVFLPLLAIPMTVLRIVGRHVMATGEPGFDVALVENSRALWDNTHNLWFLYYLLGYFATLWLLLRLWSWLSPGTRTRLASLAVRWPIHSPVILVPLCLAWALLGGQAPIGRVSADLSFVPSPLVFVNFGLCFAAGYLLFFRLSDLDTLARRWSGYMVIAGVLFVVSLAVLLAKEGTDGAAQYGLHVVLSLATGFSIGCFMLAFVGLFSRYGSGFNPWVRYFSDSAYWIYIFHSIPLVTLALALHGWQVPAEIKFLVVCTATILACLVTYQLWVRGGIVGQLLNGRRYFEFPSREASLPLQPKVAD